jgi:hypothetical protein
MVLTRGRARAAIEKEIGGPFRILDLPPEPVQGIFGDFANSEDRYSLLQMRSVCRAFKDHSLVAFGTMFFEKAIAILHPLSLSVLLNREIGEICTRLRGGKCLLDHM